MIFTIYISIYYKSIQSISNVHIETSNIKFYKPFSNDIYNLYIEKLQIYSIQFFYRILMYRINIDKLLRYTLLAFR